MAVHLFLCEFLADLIFLKNLSISLLSNVYGVIPNVRFSFYVQELEFPD